MHVSDWKNCLPGRKCWNTTDWNLFSAFCYNINKESKDTTDLLIKAVANTQVGIITEKSMLKRQPNDVNIK